MNIAVMEILLEFYTNRARPDELTCVELDKFLIGSRRLPHIKSACNRYHMEYLKTFCQVMDLKWSAVPFNHRPNLAITKKTSKELRQIFLDWVVILIEEQLK